MKDGFKLAMVAALFVLIGGCSKTPVYTSVYQEQLYEVDGSDSDWKGKMYYDQDAKMMYGLANTADELLVKLKVTDQTATRKILATGMTLWIDTVGKKKKQFGLTFPVKSDRNMQTSAGMSKNNRPAGQAGAGRGGMELAMLNQNFIAGLAPVKLTGFYGEKDETVQDFNFTGIGINAMIQVTEESLIYEVSIPLNLLFKNPGNWLNDPEKNFSYGFETGYIDMASRGGGPGGMGGGMQGGMGGRGSGGGGRGGSGGPPGNAGGGDMNDRMAEMQSMSTPDKVWIKKACLASGSN